MSERRRVALAAALALGLAPAAGAAAGLGTTEILSDAGGAIGLLSRPPPGSGEPERLPAVLLVHDAFGHDRRSQAYTQQLLGASHVVLEVELQALPSDGGAPVPTGRGLLRRAVAALAAHPGVHPARIGALGFGEGAHALVLAEERQGVAAHVLLYPGCGALLSALTGDGLPEGRSFGAVMLMHGTADEANAPAECATLAGLLAPRAAQVQVATWPGASYGWDIPPCAVGMARHPAPGGGPPVATEAWPKLTELSAARAAAFLDAALSLATQ